jgi:hypothetical protein
METRRTLRGPRCGLCLTCANRAAQEPPAPGRRRSIECVAGGEPRSALYECDSYVRVFTRAPHVPDRFRRRPRG